MLVELRSRFSTAIPGGGGIRVAMSPAAAHVLADQKHRLERSHRGFMSGRRRHERYAVGGRWEGALRVKRDVMVERTIDGTLAVISETPAVHDEILTLDLIGARTSTSLTVQVLDSRPVIVEGVVRHSLRLSVLERARQSA
jgi:hypothetical protein